MTAPAQFAATAMGSTRRMLRCPVNRAIVDFVRQCRSASAAAIGWYLGAQGLEVKRQVHNLCIAGVLANVAAPGLPGLYAAAPRAALFDEPLPADEPAHRARGTAEAAPETEPEPKPEPEPTPATQPTPVACGWVGQRVPPRQYDVMRAPAWVPPANHPARPGAGDFLQCQSRGHRC